MELAKQCSICGSCFEMLYLDEDAKIRLARVPAPNGIMICETDRGFSTPMAFIRTVISKDKDDNTVRKVEFWNSSLVMHFRSVNSGYLNLISVEEHYWQDVPFVEYINNEERLGDFEGVITEIDAYNKQVTVLFDEEKYVTYSQGELDELELAYAITIHKAQGSEYPAVIIPLLQGPRQLYYRNLLYTAVTRARKCVTVIGSESVFQEMIHNTNQQNRNTSLAERIRELNES